MAYATRESFHGLTLDTKVARDQSPSTSHRHGDRLSRREPSIQGQHDDEEESRVIDELHTATPPMLVPRSDNNSIESFESTLSYSHRPENFRRSFESFLRSDESQIEGKHKSLQQREDSRRYADDGETSFAKADPREYCSPRTIQRPRSSILCRVQTQDDDDDDVVAGENSNEEAHEAEQNGGGLSFTSSKDDRTTSDINQPTSLTSVSTMSPLVEEVRTPYDRSPDGLHQNILFSPLSSPALAHRATSLEDPNMWSSSVPNSYTGKPRSYTIERHNSWRQIMRHQSSRRSTGSSGKSPASAFLSMWSAPEECAGPQPDDEGQMVGTDYVLGKQIGFGGFSTVKEAYKVEADGSTRRLAVKIVKKHVSGKNERENDQVQAEFDHEVRIWRQLNYHHILSLEAVYETDYATFCFTKLFIGGTLFDLVKANRGGLSMSLARKYSHQLASALRYLHEDMRIVHRDIKLENCLLDPERSEDGTEGAKLVLCDFGMAEWMTNDTSGEPLDTYDNPADRPPPQSIGPSGSSTSIAGSLEYASPELLLSSAGLIDPVVDIWAFGVVVYATLVGSRPFQHGFGPRLRSSIIEGDWNRDAIVAGHEDDPDRLEVLDLLCHCLDKDTSSRWTVRQVLDSEWFSSIAEPSDEHIDERSWRL